MLLEIKQLGEPILRVKCREISYKEPDLELLVQNMLETMTAAEGVGLAAPQVGLSIRLVVIDIPEEEESVTLFKINGEEANMANYMPMVMVNPEIVSLSGKKVPFSEGCLSVLRYRAIVHRPEIACVKFTDMDGNEIEIESDGLLARCFQHEIDHLNGVLFVDRLSSAYKMTLKKKLIKLGLPVAPQKPQNTEE